MAILSLQLDVELPDHLVPVFEEEKLLQSASSILSVALATYLDRSEGFPISYLDLTPETLDWIKTQAANHSSQAEVVESIIQDAYSRANLLPFDEPLEALTQELTDKYILEIQARLPEIVLAAGGSKELHPVHRNVLNELLSSEELRLDKHDDDSE
jgi:hypothetical protein